MLHPAVAQVRTAVRPYLDRPVWVACSGGADSVALAAAVAFFVRGHGASAGLVTVDHGLQTGSAGRARDVAELAGRLGFADVEVLRAVVGTRGGPEAAARDARYAALDDLAGRSGRRLLLAHTLDDQAETVLLGLGRGSGPRSIAGMRAVDGARVRPLLGVRRATTREACAAAELPVWDDPHNLDPRFRRVRVRRELLPLAEDVLGGGVAGALARTGQLLRDDLDALDELAAAELATRIRENGLDVVGLDGRPRAVRTRVLRGWLADGPALSGVHLAAVDALVTAWRGQDHIELPGGRRVRRHSGRLCLEPASTDQPSHDEPSH